MTIRKDVSVIHNEWHDAQRVDKTDMDVEQNRNVEKDAAIVQNHFGSGILLATPEQNVIFDSDNLTAAQASILAAHNFDGTGMEPHDQPSDANLGNQLEVELTDSTVIGRLSVKVVIIGLSFDDTLQLDRFYFYKNEKQVTSKHYKRILTVFFNDFKGNNYCSRNNGGRIVIRETASFQLSRDAIMVAQDVEPDIFWRDFKVSDPTIPPGNPTVVLYNTIQAAIGPEYSVNALQINVTGRQPDRELEPNDVTTQVGQKFQAKTDNIQKITLLLGAKRDESVSQEHWFDWNGELVISVYPLQTSVKCPTEIVPELAIDFDPDTVPLAQLSVTRDSLFDYGYILTDVAQPIDFVFSATKIGSGDTSNITPGNFYAVTIRRSGAPTSGTLFAAVGNDRVENSRVTIYSGVWVDVPEEDMWFQVWTDAAKIADGQGYDFGYGILYEKTVVDPTTGTTIDNQIKNKSFVDTGENITNIGVLQALVDRSVTVQDERTGDNVYSRRQYTPSFSFVDETGIEDLKAVTEPLIIGCTKDINPRQNPALEKTQLLPGLAKGDVFCIVNPDPDLLSLNLLGSKLVPNYPCSPDYRIFKVEVCTDGYGDANGDGYIDELDIALVTSLVGESIYFNSTQQKIVDGYIKTLDLLRADVDGDGYITSTDVDLITQFVNKQINSFPVGTSFTHMCLTVQQSVGRYDGYFDCDGYIRIDGYYGLQIVNPDDLTYWELLYDGYITTPMIEMDHVFTEVPFMGVTYQILPQPYWQPHWVIMNSDARLVPAAFTEEDAIVPYSCAPALEFECEDRGSPSLFCDPGRNDFFIPGNLIMGRGSQILNADMSFFKTDIEIGTIILQLPEDPLEEVSLNVFEKLVMDSNHTEKTTAGYPAMRYSDCSTVQPEDLFLGRVKFNVAIQAMVPAIDGYDDGYSDGYADGYGIIIDDIIGVYMDHSTGILKLTAKDQYVDKVYKTLVTKIEITVFLKKAGWNPNNLIIVEPPKIAGLLST